MAAQVQVYNHANNIAEPVLEAFRRKEGAANIMYPFVLKARRFPPENQEQLWIAYFDPLGQVTFVLSCTTRSLGTYPIFIFTTNSPAECQTADITTPLRLLANQLAESIAHNARVFAVFSCEPVTREFCRIWEERSGISQIQEEYYNAIFTFCTSATLTPSSNLRILPEDRNLAIELRPADESDLPFVARLCEEFSRTSPPYVINNEGAMEEARLLIANNEVWIHLIQEDGQQWDVASIVAASRNSENIATVTKVYTNPDWRRLGCAERLLRRVCKALLSEKEKIVLYVGVGNNAAQVYRRVGFQGLEGNGEVEGVENWLEIGFDRDHVNLGYW